MRHEKKRMLAAHLVLAPWLIGAFIRRGGFAETCSKTNPDIPHGGLPLTSKLERHGDSDRFAPTQRLGRVDHSTLQSPYVIKPEYGRASRDVKITEDLPDHTEEPLLVQEYVDGIEYAINIDMSAEETVYRVIEIHPDGRLWTGEAKYVDRTDSITDELCEACSNACKEVGLEFGRLDVKADDLQALQRGEFDIIEVNGALSVDLKCYETDTFTDTVHAIRSHWKRFFQAAEDRESCQSEDTPVFTYFLWLLLQPIQASSHIDQAQK